MPYGVQCPAIQIRMCLPPFSFHVYLCVSYIFASCLPFKYIYLYLMFTYMPLAVYCQLTCAYKPCADWHVGCPCGRPQRCVGQQG